MPVSRDYHWNPVIADISKSLFSGGCLQEVADFLKARNRFIFHRDDVYGSFPSATEAISRIASQLGVLARYVWAPDPTHKPVKSNGILLGWPTQDLSGFWWISLDKWWFRRPECRCDAPVTCFCTGKHLESLRSDPGALTNDSDRENHNFRSNSRK